ncbi:MAG: futalosine hydrolase [Desulfarculaceae bacterium]|nr:futalosine hydrolase [Desulfarculaceae bacterium]MCF8071850.1 futalosine hydrolase [Desulfarculaceae bacterium]MCF8101400.1 futalosine hydrolase [Desulfarculaceae bacterium]MCF8117391.1 futalosine hydrolase [Desulfarculaceae bacterium]
MSTWLAVISMRAEAELIMPRLRPLEDIGRRPAFSGRLGGQELLVVLSGLGQVNAAQAATAALEARPGIEAVFNLGCAGACPGSGLEMSQAALATETVFADLGVQKGERLHEINLVGIPLHGAVGKGAVYNRVPCDPALNAAVAAANPGLTQGAFATVERISGDDAAARAVARRWGVVLEEMEGAAVGLVALHYGKPFVALRGVSNLAGHRELDLAGGAGAAMRALLNLEAGS